MKPKNKIQKKKQRKNQISINQGALKMVVVEWREREGKVKVKEKVINKLLECK